MDDNKNLTTEEKKQREEEVIFNHLKGLDLNEIIKTKGLMDLELIEKVLEAKKREGQLVRVRAKIQ